MDSLENLYQSQLKNVKFINRKQSVSSPRTVIIGCVGSGKTSLICEYLNRFKQDDKLYINLDDMRINRTKILSNLKQFLEAKNIKTLAIDGVILKDVEIIKSCFEICENIIISTKSKSLKIENFATINLWYLDYEEFISFFKKNLDPSMIFSHFLALGSSVKSAFLDISENVQYLQNELKKELNETQLNILRECALKCGANLSVYEIFKSIKEYAKISKDSVYNGLNELFENGYIHSVAKFNEPTSAKKLYFANFAIRNTLNLKKDFSQSFKNATFCELLKLKDEIFYTKDIDFYLPKRKLAILCVPFTSSEIVFLKFQKLHATFKELGIAKLQVISVSNNANLSVEGIKCEVLPFYQWALGF